jgi:predicted transcriptional regulator YheO
MVAEKGPEAMIPLDNGAIPINLEMPDVKKMFEGMMQSMKDAPEREVTAVASSDNRAMTELVNVMREQTEQLINAMSDMIREQKNSVSVQERILQTSM